MVKMSCLLLYLEFDTEVPIFTPFTEGKVGNFVGANGDFFNFIFNLIINTN